MIDNVQNPGLSSEERKLLASFLESDRVHPETFDFVQAHGLMTALAITPDEIAEDEWQEALFVEPPQYVSETERGQIAELLQRLKVSIARELYSGEALKLPCSLTLGKRPDDAPLRGWAMGFMEGVHLREEAWFGAEEEELGELILPIALASGMFEDESLEKLYQDPELVKELCQQIPESLSDLYLYFHAQDQAQGEEA
ncbi:MAG: YecA family protein [Gammaproteobacteria bacterium]|nr:YecA family protein [Gammaproteobacteria bacterium]